MVDDSGSSSLPAVHEAWLPHEHSLHRPRHGKRQIIATLCATLFFATPLFSYTLGARADEIENQAQETLPSPLHGVSFFAQLREWAADNLIFRKQAIDATDWISRTIFHEPPALGDHGQNGPIPNPQQGANEPHYPIAITGTNGWLYLGSEVSSHCQAEPLDETFARLSKLRRAVVASGRSFVVVIAPDKATVAPQNLPENYVGESCHRAMKAKFWNRVRNISYVIDLRDELRDRGDQLGVPVYGPKDAHWSDEGGIIMTRAIAGRLEPGITESWRIVPSETWRVPADLAKLIGRTAYTTGRHYALMPDGRHDRTRSITADFKTPVHLDTATGPGTYQRDVAYFGDSFTIRSLRYLAAAFADMTVLHHATAQHDQGAAIARLINNSDAVVLEVAERSLVRGDLPIISEPALGNIVNAIRD